VQYCTFAQWKREVDMWLSLCLGGMISDDLPDLNYRGCYLAGDTPKECAEWVKQQALDGTL
jgi:hypothetical protein